MNENFNNIKKLKKFIFLNNKRQKVKNISNENSFILNNLNNVKINKDNYNNKSYFLFKTKKINNIIRQQKLINKENLCKEKKIKNISSVLSKKKWIKESNKFIKAKSNLKKNNYNLRINLKLPPIYLSKIKNYLKKKNFEKNTDFRFYKKMMIYKKDFNDLKNYLIKFNYFNKSFKWKLNKNEINHDIKLKPFEKINIKIYLIENGIIKFLDEKCVEIFDNQFEINNLIFNLIK